MRIEQVKKLIAIYKSGPDSRGNFESTPSQEKDLETVAVYSLHAAIALSEAVDRNIFATGNMDREVLLQARQNIQEANELFKKVVGKL